MEFFNLVWEEVLKRLFEGHYPSYVPVKDNTKLFLFRLVGMMLVHTVLQDGPVSKFPKLSSSAISCMLGETVDEVSMFSVNVIYPSRSPLRISIPL